MKFWNGSKPCSSNLQPSQCRWLEFSFWLLALSYFSFQRTIWSFGGRPRPAASHYPKGPATPLRSCCALAAGSRATALTISSPGFPKGDLLFPSLSCCREKPQFPPFRPKAGRKSGAPQVFQFCLPRAPMFLLLEDESRFEDLSLREKP